MDTSYLDHLHTESKVRQSREAKLLLRKDMIEAKKRSNYQHEMGRITNESSRPNLPYMSKQNVEDRVKQLEHLAFA